MRNNAASRRSSRSQSSAAKADLEALYKNQYAALVVGVGEIARVTRE
jgi:hypothetical protein